MRRAGSSWQRCRTRTTSSSHRTTDSRANQSWRARLDPTVRCAGKPDRSALRSASRHFRFIRSSSKQKGRSGSTRRGADSNQMRLSLSSAFRSARSFRHPRRTSRARLSTCAVVQLERRRRWNRSRSLPSSSAMNHGLAHRSTDSQSTGSLATPPSAPPPGRPHPRLTPGLTFDPFELIIQSTTLREAQFHNGLRCEGTCNRCGGPSDPPVERCGR